MKRQHREIPPHILFYFIAFTILFLAPFFALICFWVVEQMSPLARYIALYVIALFALAWASKDFYKSK